FVIDGLSFLIAGATEMLIRPPRSLNRDDPQSAVRIPRSDRGPAPGVLGQAAEGFRYVAAQPGMIGFLLASAVFNALLMPITVLLPVYATTSLHADVGWYG